MTDPPGSEIRRAGRPLDPVVSAVLTTALLIVMLLVGGLAVIAGLLIGVDAMGCATEGCAIVKRVGAGIAVLGVVTAATAGLIVTIVRLVRRRPGFRPAGVAMAVMVGAVIVGALIGAVGSAITR